MPERNVSGSSASHDRIDLIFSSLMAQITTYDKRIGSSAFQGDLETTREAAYLRTELESMETNHGQLGRALLNSSGSLRFRAQPAVFAKGEKTDSLAFNTRGTYRGYIAMLLLFIQLRHRHAYLLLILYTMVI
jgi:hypothetical protein